MSKVSQQAFSDEYIEIIKQPSPCAPVDEPLRHDEVPPGSIRSQMQESCDSGKTSATWIDEEEQVDISEDGYPSDCVRIVRQEPDYDSPSAFF